MSFAKSPIYRPPAVALFPSSAEKSTVANVCLHFGGPLECKDGKLVCPWHNAAFNMTTGERLEGPAPKDAKLMFLSTQVKGDALYYVWGE